MLIPNECPFCGLIFQVEARHAGKVGTCPHPECGRKYLVPIPQKATTSGDPKPPQRSRSAKPPATRQRTRTLAIKSPPRRGSSLSRKPHPSAKWRITNTWIAAGIAVGVVFLGAVTYLNRPDSPAEQIAGSQPIPSEQLQLVALKTHPASADSFQKNVEPFLKKFCFDCHGNGAEEGGLKLDEFSQPEAFHKNRKTAEAVYKMLNAGVMPPEEGEQPTMEERQRAVDWIDAKLYYVDCGLPPDPGRVTIRRLNRAEYNNTIRDLVGIDFEPAADFPSDEVGNGFDNIGDVLSLPPLLLEKYLDARRRLAL
jgi:hypothetical protein